MGGEAGLPVFPAILPTAEPGHACCAPEEPDDGGDACCTPAAPEPEALPATCPACGTRGRKVGAITVRSLALQPPPDALLDAGTWRFCPDRDCPVAWFGGTPDDRRVITVAGSRVPIYQKSDDPDRLVCYCFGHTVAGIRAEVAATGDSTVPADIAERCRRGEDRCPETNPQGSCCLGNVHAEVRAARG